MSLTERIEWDKHCLVYCGPERCNCGASTWPYEREMHEERLEQIEAHCKEKRKTDAQVTEVLNILQEECAEVIQMISKCRRFGIDNIHIKSGRTNRARLTEEIGDLLAMVELLVEFGEINSTELNQATLDKHEKLKKWSTIYSEGSNE
ncbi:MAG TPA: MazG nucleotide pyrophosphohydrolase domain-containing protein [Methanosarcina sp.]|nr:MazG nucleotide pyrophosphohydrolase domain-containing protein [Methanosarcina sp.]